MGTEQPVACPGERMGQQVGCAGEVAGGGTASRKGMKCELEAQLLLVSSRFSSPKWGGLGEGRVEGAGLGAGPGAQARPDVSH